MSRRAVEDVVRAQVKKGKHILTLTYNETNNTIEYEGDNIWMEAYMGNKEILKQNERALKSVVLSKKPNKHLVVIKHPGQYETDPFETENQDNATSKHTKREQIMKKLNKFNSSTYVPGDTDSSDEESINNSIGSLHPTLSSSNSSVSSMSSVTSTQTRKKPRVEASSVTDTVRNENTPGPSTNCYCPISNWCCNS
jgi:hypothetical protein